MVPTANTPTAMDRTTSTVRSLCVPRSRMTLRQRTLRTSRARQKGGKVVAGIEPAIHDPPVGHMDDAPRLRCEIGVVGDHDDRPAAVDQGPEEVEDDVGGERIEI